MLATELLLEKYLIFEAQEMNYIETTSNTWLKKKKKQQITLIL